MIMNVIFLLFLMLCSFLIGWFLGEQNKRFDIDIKNIKPDDIQKEWEKITESINGFNGKIRINCRFYTQEKE